MPVPPQGVQSAHMRTYAHAVPAPHTQSAACHSLFPGYIVTATKLMRSQLSPSVFTFCVCVFFPRPLPKKQLRVKMHSFSLLPAPFWTSRVPRWWPNTKGLNSLEGGGLGLQGHGRAGSWWLPGQVLISHSCCRRDRLPVVWAGETELLSNCLSKTHHAWPPGPDAETGTSESLPQRRNSKWKQCGKDTISNRMVGGSNLFKWIKYRKRGCNECPASKNPQVKYCVHRNSMV